MKTYKSMLLLTAITLLAMSPVVSYAQYTMLVHKTDGNVLRLSLADVDSVTFDYSSDQTVIHEYVDLGLSVMWATCNVGTSSPLMTGDYYAWGEKETHYVGDFQSGGVEWKEGKTGYNWTSYYYRIAESEWNTVTVSKYNSDASRGNVDNKTTLDMGDDVAYVKWGGDWRMPSYEEFEELIKSCTWIRSNHNGIDGYTVRSNLNGDSIFFPYSGEFIWDINVPNNATEVMCWTRTVGKAGTGHAYYMTTDNGKASMAYNQRCFGLTVRPVFVSDKYDSTKVAYIVLGNAELQLNTGASERISCYTYSSLGNSLTADVNWSSTDPSVATVSNDGTVTAVKAGTCKVVASIGSISRMCDVIVTTQVLPSSASGSNNGYGYVDLGLSVKWAICNIGADNPEDYGDYFAWGETEPYYADSYSQSNNPVWKDGKSNGYSWSSYKYANGSNGALTKYCTDSSKGYNGFVDNKTVLDLEDDAAHVNWGGNWRMPTQEEMEELRGKCSWSWTTLNGVVGYLVTSQVAGYENSSIFFPAAGSRSGTYLSGVGTKGKYWSNTFGRYYSDESIYGCNFEMSSGFSYSHSNYGTIRYYGMSIRPVCVKRLEQLYDLTLSESSLQLHVGGTRELLADTSGIGPVELAWSSTNDSVATVRGGVVTAIGAGTCEIILTAGDHQGICDVTVYENTDHEYVDLGLSVLWATCNVGASSPEGYGEYYSWGELEPKSSYYNNTYKFITGAQQHSGGTYTKYCNSDGKTVLEPEDDVAQIKWGGGWRIPSPDECSELLNNCTWTWTSLNGINGCLIVSKINGKSIFLPASGSKWYDDPTATSLGSSGSYHTNKVYTSESTRYVMCFSSPGTDARVSYGSRYPGSSVRPVISPSDTVKQVGPPANEIWYTSTDGAIVIPYNSNDFGSALISNTYSDGRGVLKFESPVTSFGDMAFGGCNNLSSISIPSSVGTVGVYAFRSCPNLDSISVAAGNTVYDSRNNCNAIIETATNKLIVGCNKTIIPSGITSINEMAFMGFTGLETVVIPESVTNIGMAAFAGCGGLSSISVAAGNTVYDSRNNCNAIIETATNKLIAGCDNTVIPADVSSIDVYAFANCSFTTLNIPEGVTSIAAGAFMGCSRLSSLNLPQAITVIEDLTFGDCSSLTSIIIPEGVTTIGEHAFSRSGLTSVDIPIGVKSIGFDAFGMCDKLESVTFSDSVKTIGDYAFRYCTKLTSAVIPAVTDSIGVDAFYGCSSLEYVELLSITPPRLGQYAFGYDNDYPIYVPSLSVASYKSAEVWSNYADRIKANPLDNSGYFENNHEYVDLGLSVMWATCNLGAASPEEYGDYYCWGETSPKNGYYENNYRHSNGASDQKTKYCYDPNYGFNGYFDNKIMLDPEDDAAHVSWGGEWRIPTYDEINELLNNCDWTAVDSNGVEGYLVKSRINNNSIFLPDAGEKWYDNDYSNGAGRYGVYRSSSLSSSRGCSPYELSTDGSCHISSGVSWAGYSIRPVCVTADTNPGCPPDNEIWYKSTNGEIVTPYKDDVFGASIVSNTYTDGKGIIEFDGPVTSIGLRSFFACSSLMSLSIPNSASNIDRYAFAGCGNLRTLKMSDSIESIAAYAFNGCGITSLVIPETVTEIANDAFACSKLYSIKVDSMNTNYDSRNGCNAIIETATNKLVVGCNSSVVPSGVICIGTHAFYSSFFFTCVIPDGVTSIESAAFFNCAYARKITIPDSVESIGDEAFTGCYDLSSLVISAVTPPVAGTNILKSTDYCTIYVPAESVEAYKSAENWSVYADRIQAIP